MKPIRMNDQILTRAEVAKMLRVNERTVLALSNRGDLPCLVIGRGANAKRVYLERDVQKFIESRRDQASSRLKFEVRPRLSGEGRTVRRRRPKAP